MADDIYLRLLYRRVLNNNDSSLIQLAFDAAVVDKYRGAPGYAIVRTNNVGRIKREGGWTLDLGIADDTVHASLRDLLNVLPDSEREHWAEHAASLPVSSPFLQMQLQPNSCFDDGELRPWE
jgi:hypothetical protein